MMTNMPTHVSLLEQVAMNFGEWFVDGNIFMKSGVTIDAR